MSTQEMLAGNLPEPSAEASSDELERLARKEQIISAILSEPNMQVVRWDRLMGGGVLIKLEIGHPRFRTSLEPSDLGISLPRDRRAREAMERIFQLGKKALLPQDYLERIERIENRARKWLVRSSFETEFGRFVPHTSYQDWKERTALMGQEFMQVRDEIIRDYKKIVTRVLRDHVQAARHAYNLLHGIQVDSITGEEGITPEQSRERSRHMAQVARRVREAIPTVVEIEVKFRFQFTPTFIDLRPLMPDGTLMIDSEEVRAWQLQKEMEQEQRRAMDAMINDVVASARKQKQQMIDQFLNDLITQLRALVYEACLNVAASLKSGRGTRTTKEGNERMHPGLLSQLSTMIEQARSLNFYNDRDIDRMCNLVEREIKTPPKDRSLQEIEQLLTEIATVNRSTLLSLEYEFADTREEREILVEAGIASVPAYEEVREAREELELDPGVLAALFPRPQEREGSTPEQSSARRRTAAALGEAAFSEEREER